MTVLLLEDAVDLRELIALMLEAPDRRILTAADEADALEIARTTPIDLLVVDIVLPGLDGPEVAEQLRALQPGLAVLYISGWYDHPDFPQLRDEHVLPKPFSRARLNEAVEAVLAGSPPAT